MARYVYNPGTNKLHIEGYCVHSGAGFGKIVFKSEQEALAYDGRAVSMCKICIKKREVKTGEII